eukprot:359913-Chlamydomonas_euryale.AAC.10
MAARRRNLQQHKRQWALTSLALIRLQDTQLCGVLGRLVVRNTRVIQTAGQQHMWEAQARFAAASSSTAPVPMRACPRVVQVVVGTVSSDACVGCCVRHGVAPLAALLENKRQRLVAHGGQHVEEGHVQDSRRKAAGVCVDGCAGCNSACMQTRRGREDPSTQKRPQGCPAADYQRPCHTFDLSEYNLPLTLPPTRPGTHGVPLDCAPADRPHTASCWCVVTPASTSARDTASRSSPELRLPARRPALAHRAPSSPPPRTCASASTTPASSAGRDRRAPVCAIHAYNARTRMNGVGACRRGHGCSGHDAPGHGAACRHRHRHAAAVMAGGPQRERLIARSVKVSGNFLHLRNRSAAMQPTPGPTCSLSCSPHAMQKSSAVTGVSLSSGAAALGRSTYNSFSDGASPAAGTTANCSASEPLTSPVGSAPVPPTPQPPRPCPGPS